MNLKYVITERFWKVSWYHLLFVPDCKKKQVFSCDHFRVGAIILKKPIHNMGIFWENETREKYYSGNNLETKRNGSSTELSQKSSSQKNNHREFPKYHNKQGHQKVQRRHKQIQLKLQQITTFHTHRTSSHHVSSHFSTSHFPTFSYCRRFQSYMIHFLHPNFNFPLIYSILSVLGLACTTRC